MNNLINAKKKTFIYEEILTENIPMCTSCLFEIKDGEYVCKDCRLNLCEAHLENHVKHKILKLIKK